MRNICEKLLVFRPGDLVIFFFTNFCSGGHFDQWSGTT